MRKLRLTFRAKVFWAITCINVLAIAAIAFVFCQSSARFLENQYAASLQNNAYIGTRNLDKAFQRVYELTMNAAFDPRLLQAIREFDAYRHREDMRAISVSLRANKAQDALIASVYVFLPGEGLLIKSTEYNPLQNAESSETSEWTAALREGDGAARHVLSPVSMIDDFSASPKRVFTYAQPLVDGDSGAVLAWLAVNMDERNIYYEYLDDMGRSADTNVYLQDPADNVVSGNDKTEYWEEFTRGSSTPPRDVSASGKLAYQADSSICWRPAAIGKVPTSC